VLLLTVVLGGCKASGSDQTTAATSPTSSVPKIEATTNITTGTIVVPPGKWANLVFDVSVVSMSRITVEGWFHASGGAENDIEVFIAKEDDYNEWAQGRAIKPLYNTGRTTLGNINVGLSSSTERYHLVFNNIYSTSMKYIQAEIDLKYLTPRKTTTPSTSKPASSDNSTSSANTTSSDK
jgi:hypothetical protein